MMVWIAWSWHWGRSITTAICIHDVTACFLTYFMNYEYVFQDKVSYHHFLIDFILQLLIHLIKSTDKERNVSKNIRNLKAFHLTISTNYLCHNKIVINAFILIIWYWFLFLCYIKFMICLHFWWPFPLIYIYDNTHFIWHERIYIRLC